ncbi:MAG: ABC transporter substrate-binding protein [Alphaproteobacteria bacterium]|nr:ABC transporter substrate-binding protein [Alphaproteobacteria bacterium]
MKLAQSLFVILLSAILASAAAYYIGGARRMEGTNAAVGKETRLEQVKRTGVIRCGYFINAPFDMKDPNTGKMSGVMVDVTEEIGRQLKLKIEWAGEVAPGQMFSDLALGRYDVVCTPFFQTPGRAREGDFTKPVFYMPAYLYVRKDDTRFDKDIMAANKPEIRFAGIDGEISGIWAQERFPLARKVALPELVSVNDLFLAVLSKKADAFIDDYGTFIEWNRNNPGKMRIAGGTMLSVTALGMPIPANEPAFKATLDTTIAYLIDSGFVDKVLDKYEGTRKMPRVARPYAASGKTTP